MDRDPAAASAEYMAQFRTDVEGFPTREAVEASVELNVRERPFEGKHNYIAFVDPSGGSSDAMTLAIAHKEGETEVLDLIRRVTLLRSARRWGGLILSDFLSLFLSL